MHHPKKAYEMIIEHEVGVNSADLEGSPIRAATSSFILFSIGAILPLFPFFFTTGNQAIIISGIMSAIGLFVI